VESPEAKGTQIANVLLHNIIATKYQFQNFNKENISNIAKEFCASNSQNPVVLQEVFRVFPQSPSDISVASGDLILKCVWWSLFRISSEISLQGFVVFLSFCS
jgi:hypothetical protein